MWNIISGFDTLETEYKYNSQDQVIEYSHLGNGVKVSFSNSYDYAGRLSSVDKFDIPDVPNPELINLAQYSYNENSQLYELIFGGSMRNFYFYDTRGRIVYFQNNDGIFEYTNEYFLNGNVKSQEFSGSYNDNFVNTSDLNFNYKYDLSNRLIETENDNTQHKDNFKLENAYDKDGNITELKRYNGIGSIMDNFNYSYYSGTNKLQRVFGAGNQFIYDNNGNVTSEELNNNSEMKYDQRNLLTQLRHRSQIITDSSYYVSYYNYDEAGNRISKKVYKYTGSEPEPPPPDIDSLDAETDWELENDVIYSRDITGKELAIYESDTLLQWNIHGLDNVGKIDAGGIKYFYFKDHLGSVRAIVDENPAVVFAEDYDAWGYGLEERNYAKDNSMYKFTGKERDQESEYDYFGARYYDARVGRWGQMEPLLNKYPGISPYVYSLDNPLIIVDPNGKDPIRENLGSISDVVKILNENSGKTYGELSYVFSKAKIQYLATEKSGFLDLEHFFAAAQLSSRMGVIPALVAGEVVEHLQYLGSSPSAYNEEDPQSNLEGANFGSKFQDVSEVSKNFNNYINNLVPIDPSDQRLSSQKIYIPENRTQYLNDPLPQRFPNLMLIPFIGIYPVLNYSPSFGSNPNDHQESLREFNK